LSGISRGFKLSKNNLKQTTAVTNQPNVYIGLSEGTSYSCSNNQGSNVFLRQNFSFYLGYTVQGSDFEQCSSKW